MYSEIIYFIIYSCGVILEATRKKETEITERRIIIAHHRKSGRSSFGYTEDIGSGTCGYLRRICRVD